MGFATICSVAVVAGAVIVAASVSVHAAEASGWINRIDAKSNAITLNDGGTYLLPATITTLSMKLGERVRVTYVLQGTRRVVTRIERSN